MLVIVLEHARGSVGDIVDAGAAQPSCLQHVGGFVQLTATVFEIGRRSAHLRDETIEHVGNRFARPGLTHGDPDTVDVFQSGRSPQELMVMGVDGQNGSNLARAQANADIDHPDQAVAEGGVGKRQAPQPTSGLNADDRESDEPVDDGLWTRSPLDAEV